MTSSKKPVTPIDDSQEPEAGQSALVGDETCLTERPDGFYWQDKLTGKFYGPFPSSSEALLDMQYQADSDYEVGETLHEAEEEIGIADWIDPDTGQPAEDSAPHLSDE